jgi:hypothetical protein
MDCAPEGRGEVIGAHRNSRPVHDILSSSYQRGAEKPQNSLTNACSALAGEIVMKRFLVMALLICACACGLHAQAVDTTVCAIVKNPKSFDGKIVRIKGTVVVGLDQFIVKDADTCGFPVDGIWLEYPLGTKGKAGAAAVVRLQPAHNFAGTYTAPTRTAVTLDNKNKDFKQFDSALSQTPKRMSGMCLGCSRFSVTATLVGRLDGVANAALVHDKSGKIIELGGFGNMNAYPARLVLQSVSDVVEKEEDYSKTPPPAKGEFGPPPQPSQDMFDPVSAAGKSIEKMKGTPAGDQVAKNVAEFAKGTGAIISYGPINETSPKDEMPAAKDSPDGVQFNCIINQNRLTGDAEYRTIVHMGQHIADLRTTAAGTDDTPLYVLEYNSWSMTVAVAAYNGQRSLTMPGGSVLWDSAWTAEERNDKMDQAIKDYLAKEAALSR